MNKERKYIVRTERDISELILMLSSINLDQPVQVIWKTWTPKRSLPANNLYWVWMEQLAKEFNRREKMEGMSYDKDNMHDLCRHFFLGYENCKIRNTVIEKQLKSTAKLSRAAMCQYMEQINVWATDLSIKLPYPINSEYSRYLEDNR